ncbi:MAG: hypothetical protein Q7S52_03845 [bacterium]|nr:hypothetical protein [bacterium]
MQVIKEHGFNFFVVSYHRETRPDEVFLANQTEEGFGLNGWPSKRKGEPFRRSDDPDMVFFPVFIKRKEVTEKGFIIKAWSRSHLQLVKS